MHTNDQPMVEMFLQEMKKEIQKSHDWAGGLNTRIMYQPGTSYLLTVLRDSFIKIQFSVFV
jgi:hypothetical protein